MTSDSHLQIVYEDNHLLVINKPPLLATMGVSADEDSLLVRAKNYLRDKYNKPGNVYLGVVSRLDSFTSGVVVLARTSKAAARLTQQFREQRTAKRYLAVVADSVPAAATWQDQLAKNEQQHRMVVVDEDHNDPTAQAKSKTARLSFEALESSPTGQTLVAIELLTGRKHQIRTQFAARGYPIWGDRKYGSLESYSPGIVLHAAYLKIEHPTLKKPISFSATPDHWGKNWRGKWPFDRTIRQYLKKLAAEHTLEI